MDGMGGGRATYGVHIRTCAPLHVSPVVCVRRKANGQPSRSHQGMHHSCLVLPRVPRWVRWAVDTQPRAALALCRKRRHPPSASPVPMPRRAMPCSVLASEAHACCMLPAARARARAQAAALVEDRPGAGSGSVAGVIGRTVCIVCWPAQAPVENESSLGQAVVRTESR